MLLGLPGAALYRFANTADAMWGYRDRREWSGKFAARADDVVNLIPARLTALALLGAGSLRRGGLAALAREAGRTASPNSGWPMAALALALGVRLGKPGVYVLNPDGAVPGPADCVLRCGAWRSPAPCSGWRRRPGARRRMAEPPAIHGGTDAGPDPLWDFSTNANALGPCPTVLHAVQAADLTRYPDPLYTALREALAAHHATDPARIAVGAGASELILRLVRALPGPVLVPAPGFAEYARCARIEGRAVIEAHSPDEFLHRQHEAGLGFVCWPNNPTGEVWPAAFLRRAAAAGRVVVDLAYAPLCPDGVIDAPAAALRLLRAQQGLWTYRGARGLCGGAAGLAGA